MEQKGTRGRANARGASALGSVLCAGALALCLAPGAAADFDFCPPGEGAGQCAEPVNLNSLRGLDLDREKGLLYVADRGNNRIEVFEEDGDFVKAFGWGVKDGKSEAQSCGPAVPEANPNPALCRAGIPGGGKGQMKGPVGVAVDNDPASPSFHSLYVVDRDNFRIQKFGPAGEFVWTIGKGVNQTSGADLCTAASGDVCGAGLNSEAAGGFSSNIGSHFFAAVGPGGAIYVLDSPLIAGGGEKFKHRLQRFKDDGTPLLPECILFEGGGRANALATAGDGSFWVESEDSGQGIRRYDSGCALKAGPIDTDVGTAANALTLDAAGRLFAAQSENYWAITAHDGAGAILSRFGYGRLPIRPEGLAVGAAGVFASLRETGIRRLEFPPPTPSLPPPGPIIAPPSVQVTSKSARAEVDFQVNPEGKATEYVLQWVDLAHWEAEGFNGAIGESEPTKVPMSETDKFRLHSEKGTIGCAEATKELIEEGKCLTPKTDYRFRILAANADNPEGSGEARVEGQFETKKPLEIEAIFATRIGTDSARLHVALDPLGIAAGGYFEYVEEAAYESDIEGGGDGFAAAAKLPAIDAEPPEAELPLGSGEGSTESSAVAYPLAPGTSYRYRLAASNELIDEHLLSAEVGSFRTFKAPEVPLCPANESFRSGAGALLPDCRAYELVSPLEKGGADIRPLNARFFEPAVLEQSSLAGERLAYGSSRAFGDALSSPWTSQYLAERIPDLDGKWDPDEGWQTHAIGPPRGERLTGGLVVEGDTEFRFFSPDLCGAWLTNYGELALPAPPAKYAAGYPNLLRREDRLCGTEGYMPLAPLSAPQGVPPGSEFRLELQGVSEDLARAIFTSNGKLGPGGTGGVRQLYESFPGPGGAPGLRLVCVLPGGSAWGGACTAGSSDVGSLKSRETSASGAISADGSRIYWSEKAIGEGKLYVRVSGSKTVAVSATPSFFWGASTDGEKAIYTSGGGLHEFTLASESSSQLAGGALGVMGMSEDGDRVYFASEEAIAGSGENSAGAEATAGKANLYLREAGAGPPSTAFVATLSGKDLAPSLGDDGAIAREPRIRSARVSPDGTRAAFTSFAPLTGYDNRQAGTGESTKQVYLYDAGAGELLCASCNPSGARPDGPSGIPGFETQMHAARVLSEDGRRLFFESADALAPRDSNGALDVYQWEEPGKGSCNEASADFAAAAGGCVSLISSGQSPLDARFVEATPEGDDVFFATLSGLLPQDYGLIDIYDARVGGGLPVPPEPPDICEGETCRSPPPPPEEITPASAALEGHGNPKAGKLRCARRGKAKGKGPRARKVKGPARRCRGNRRGRAGR